MDQTVISASHDEIQEPAHAAEVIRRERVRIDAADRAILAAMRERFNAVAAVGEAKRRAGLPVYDAAREAALYARISEMAGDLAPAALALWRVMTGPPDGWRGSKTVMRRRIRRIRPLRWIFRRR